MKKLFFLLFALPLFAACTETGNEPEPQPQPEPEKKAQLILTSNEVMNFNAEGGQGLIDYTLVNAKEGVEFASECEADWISDFVFGEDITFVVAENEGEAREAQIVITYAEASMEVTVKQAAKTEEPEPTAPIIVISSENPMEFDMNGGIGTIEYTIENPIAGVSLTAKADAAWIAQTTVQAEKIIFQVLANEVEEAREGKITLTYGMLEPVEVIVKQAAYAAPAPVFTFDPATLEVSFEGGAQSVAYTIENAIEGAEVVATCEAAWVSNLVATNGTLTFDVAANEESLRQAIIVLTYGDYAFEYVVKQLPANYNPGLNYLAFTVVEAWADLKEGGNVWNVTFVEHDELLGDMQTVISFYIEEANVHSLVSGTYTTAEGTILLNNASRNGYSTYRANASLATDISDASFVVAVDTETQTISFDGSFQAGNDIVALSYTGAVRGMDLSGNTSNEVNCTEWKRFDKNYQDATECIFTGRSSDNALEIMFHIQHSGGTKVIPAGTYEVAPFEPQGDVLADTSTVTYNSVKDSFASGSITVTHLRGMYNFEFEIVDTLGRRFTGNYTGELGNGGTNP
ncbi:MAG: BACON domain-containing protein [Alistipes sp.]|nr:BACON domain-containing protein [Alistipes sp.]